MSRAATSPELVKYRGPEQWTELYLAVQPATSVYTARVNQSFSTVDKVAQLTYDGGSGTLANVLEGMTMWIGSTAGAYDKGIVRVRKAPTSTIFYIGATSDVQFSDNDYITVVNTFMPWQRALTTHGLVVKMDYDLAFPTTTGGYAAPIVRMGPTCAVLRLVGSTVSIQLTVSGYSPITTISSYVTAAPGSSATSGLTTTTPTITYDTLGCYRVATTVTDANGRTGVGYRWIFVVSATAPTSPAFELASPCTADFESGGWSFEIECTSGADISTIYDGALVCLWGRDYYGGVEGSIGPVTNYENVICVGWIAENSIVWSPEQSTVTFTVRSLDWWMDQEPSYPTGLFDNATPDAWTEFVTLSCDDIMYHFLKWRSTVSLIADCYFTGDTRRMRYINVPAGSLWQQLKAMADDVIYAKPLVNCLGQLYVQIDLNLLASAARSAIPVVQAITSDDWLDTIDITHPTPERAFVELSGVKSFNGTVAPPLFSRAPGTEYKHFGSLDTPGNHLFTNQAECNQIAGSLLAEANAPYQLTIPLTNQRLLDMCPYQYVTVTIATADTPWGIAMTDQKFVPRRIERTHDAETGLLTTTIICVQETIGVAGVAYYPPQGTTTPPIPPIDIELPPIFPGPGTDFPPVVSPPPGDTPPCDETGDVNGAWPLVWDIGHLNVATGETVARASFPASMRATGATFHSFVSINLTGTGLWYNHIHLYIMDGDTRLGEATLYGIVGETITWDISDILVVPTEITGFELELDTDTDSDFSWSVGTEVGYFNLAPGSGSTRVPIETLVPYGGPVLTVGNYYRLSIMGGNLDHYNEDDNSEDWIVARTNCQFSLTSLLTAGGGRFYTGNIGSRAEYHGLGFPGTDTFEYWRLRPIGAIWFYVWNLAVSGAHVALTQVELDAIAPPDGRDDTMLGCDILFQAVGTQVGVKCSQVPIGPWNDTSTEWRCRIMNMTVTGDRQAFIGNSFVENICGT